MAHSRFACEWIWVVLSVWLVGSSASSVAQPCCENGRFLNLELFKCVVPTSEFATETYTEQTEPTDVSLNCSHGWASFTANVTPTSTVTEPRFNQTFQADKYCFHVEGENQNKTTIIHCQPEPLEVKKCCPVGFAVNRTLIGRCVQTENTFNASYFVQPPGWPLTVEPNVTLTCDYDYNVFVPKMFVDHRFIVSNTGQLIVKAAMYKVFRFTTDYCIDSAVKDTGEEEPIALTCLPWNMYLVRSILWGIFPWTQLISALLLLVTLFIYVAFPSLHNNLQGKAMICFLVCMFIVQLEYGVLLALPTEPHTWCYFKLYVSTYFRYASSTWITVMGFLIWRQLSAPRGPKKSRWLEFLLLSIYAWGVPLILNMVVVGKIKSFGNGRVCWFSNHTVRLLMHMPNVVLVTLNLIFFIPSVIKVYGSIKFLKKSVTPVHLSKLEKQRITTIFRFFLLMQFYTIPRIVHEIVDNDVVGPVYVVFSVTLYQLIGPAMFYFFVCKTEVFRLISKAIGTEKLSKSWSSISSRIRTASSGLLGRSRSYSTEAEEGHKIPQPLADGSFKIKGEDNPTFIPSNSSTDLSSS